MTRALLERARPKDGPWSARVAERCASGRSVPGLLLALAVLLAACSSVPVLGGGEDGDGSVGSKLYARREEVRRSLEHFVERFSGSVQSRADEIAAEAQDPEVVRNALAWKVRAIAACRTSVFQENPVAALLDTWGVVVQMRLQFEEGEAQDAFGDWQERVVEVSSDLEAEFLRVARSLLEDEQVEDIQASLVSWAREDPLQGSLMRGTVEPPGLAEREDRDDLLGKLINLPFSSLARLTGVSETARAIESASAALDRATRIVRHLPLDTRWQGELLAQELQRKESVVALTENLDTVAKGIEELPANLEERLVTVLDRSQEELQDVRKTTEEAHATVEAAQAALEEMQRAGVAWEGAFGALAEVTGSSDAQGEPAAEEEPAPEENAQEDAGPVETLEAVESSARELRLLGRELDGLLEKGAIERAERSVETLLDGATALVVRVALALAGLMVLFFLLLGVYRSLQARRAERERTA